MTFKIDLLNCSLDATARCKHDRDLVRKILQLKNYITYYLHSLTYQKNFKEIFFGDIELFAKLVSLVHPKIFDIISIPQLGNIGVTKFVQINNFTHRHSNMRKVYLPLGV